MVVPGCFIRSFFIHLKVLFMKSCACWLLSPTSNLKGRLYDIHHFAVKKNNFGQSKQTRLYSVRKHQINCNTRNYSAGLLSLPLLFYCSSTYYNTLLDQKERKSDFT